MIKLLGKISKRFSSKNILQNTTAKPLISGWTAKPLSGSSAERLSRCSGCQLPASRWSKSADLRALVQTNLFMVLLLM